MDIKETALRRTANIRGHLIPEPCAADGKLGSEDEKKSFESVFNFLRDEILRDLPAELPKHSREWMFKLIDTTVPGGKMNRGLTVVHALQLLMENRKLRRNEIFKAQVLGWCVEWLQAFFLVADDIMDQSLTRRGVPCWYRQPHSLGTNAKEMVGLIAVNDSLLLESFIFKIIKKHFQQEPYYAELVNLFHETIHQTEVGQLLDLTSNLPGGKVDLSLFTLPNYKLIVKYKTAFYSFYLPVAIAMLLAGINSQPAFEQAADILIPMGEYFQIQDDFLDCYGDPKVIGKIGRDIEENKCSWLVVQALLHVSPQQRKILEKHYGRDNAADVAKVKELYNEIGLTKIFKDYEEKSFQEIKKMIDNVRSVPAAVFTDLLGQIYKRKL